MKKYRSKMRSALTIAALSASMMATTSVVNNVSTVHADAINSSQNNTKNNIVTGTWGTTSWKANTSTGEVTVSGGVAGKASDAPWKTVYANSIYGMKHIYNIVFTDKIILPADCSGLFSGLVELSSIDGMNNFDTSNVTDMSGMFKYDQSLSFIDVSSFDTSKVTNMNSMFCENFNLQSLDLSKFDTSRVTDMSLMFRYDMAIKSLNLSSFNTQNVTDMSGMFNNVKHIKSLNLSSFNTSNVTNMSGMFFNSNALSYVNLSSFDMSKVKDTSSMFASDSELNTLVLGPNNKFAKNTKLPEVPSTDEYSGKWQNIKDSTGKDIDNGNLYTSNDLMTSYTSDKAGTYTWAKKSNDVSDLKDLYNKTKLAISYSGGMFNSQPGNSFKYANEFSGRSMFGAMDYAYNSKDYDGLIKAMHDTIKKAHESIGSLQVNETKAKELDLDVNQLKADLAKDAVPYDYSNDNDIDGINKQLDSFASVRAQYNKLVQQGVFDKSNYWNNN